ncbi:MAG: hypothetical protein J2P31_14585, partial [Blastocatellia bacterium]|nr:hypothetical protein [Blastocatellia bacterium]
MVFNEVINKSFAKTIEGKLTPDAIVNISQTVDTYYKRMLQQYRIPEGQIYIIGCSDLKVFDTGDLAKMITYKTGKQIILLDLQTEASLDIAGTIPRRFLDKSTWFDNRGMSVLIDVGNCNTKGGYQQIRMLPTGNPDYIFETFGIPEGTITFTDEVAARAGESADLRKFADHARMLSEKSILEALKIEMGKRPGLVNRKKIYLSGDIVWAMVTLLFPEDSRSTVSLRVEDINEFYNRAVSDPQGLLRPNLPKIRAKRARLEAEKEIEDVRNTFTPE